jgi:cell wall-associated NlpC family hydrolase
LVFFRLERNHVGHVGIYAGDSRFIHAPRPGSKVTYGRLDSPFWRRRFVGAGGFM